MKIFIIIAILLDFVSLLLALTEDKYLNKSDKIKYSLGILLIPIIGAVVVIYLLGVRGKKEENSDGGDFVDVPPSYSSGGDSGGGGD